MELTARRLLFVDRSSDPASNRFPLTVSRRDDVEPGVKSGIPGLFFIRAPDNLPQASANAEC